MLFLIGVRRYSNKKNSITAFNTMKISEKSWAHFGRGMMVLGGASCVLIALLPTDLALNYFLRFIVGSYGVASILLFWNNR